MRQDAEGDVGAGDAIELLHRPEHGVTINTVERAYHGQTKLIPRLTDLEDLSESWRHWAERVLTRSS